MNAIISNENLQIDSLKEQLKVVPSMEGLELSSSVSTKESYFIGDENSDIKISVRFRCEKNILRCLTDRGCYLKVFPMNSTYEEMKKWDPNGFFLSNGPGDPSACRSN